MKLKGEDNSMKIWRKFLAVTLALAVVISLSSTMEKVEAATDTLTPALAKLPGNANPLFTHKFGADPYAMVYNDRVYVYMTNDHLQYNADGTVKDISYSLINKITVVSSDDMVNWTDHGEILAAGPQGAAKWANNSWAPAAAHKTINGKDKFFLYFADSGNGIGVLTADSPIGPFTDPIGKALINRNTPGAGDVTWLFDPAVLVDDDGSGYIYFGGGIPTGKDADPGTARVAKLAADMISLDLSASGGVVKPINPPWLFEDSGIHKYNGKYYYSYCTNFSNGHPSDIPAGTIGYMVSDNPMGPFTFVKTILDNPSVFFDVGGNNHHAIFEFKGEWYITYHAQTLAKAMAESGAAPMGGQPRGYRITHINKLSYDENGVIRNITADYAGVPQLKNVNPYTRTEAETIGWNGGISTEKITEPGGMLNSINLAVSDIQDSDWTAVSKVDFGDTGAGVFKANVASASDGGTIELRLDRADGTLIGTLPIMNTGGESSWKTVATSISGGSGVHDLYMVYRGSSSSNLFKVDYWQFEQKATDQTLVALNASIDKQKFDIVPGKNEARLLVTAIYADGTSVDVTAEAAVVPNQSNIVSVNKGVVTGIGYGSTSLNISYGGKTDTLHLTVKDLQSELTVKQITIDNSSFVLDPGRTAKFNVTAEYFDGHFEDVTNTATYSLSNPDIADVSKGKITAKGNGTTLVTVGYKGVLGDEVTAQISITVNVPAVVAIEAETAADNTDTAYVQGVANGYTWTLVDGLSTKAMQFTPDDGITVTSGTDANSLAAGSKLGYKIHFANSGTYNVWILAKSRNFQTDSVHVGLDNTYKFSANGIQSVSNSQFKWINLGLMTGASSLNISAGEHELNFWGRESGLIIDRIYLTTSNTAEDPIWPSNNVAVSGVSLDKSTISLKTGDEETLTATITPADATSKTVTFSSSNPGVATVTNATYDASNGTTRTIVHAIAAGEAVITATTADGNKTAVSHVTVAPEVQPQAPVAELSSVSSVRPESSFIVELSLNNVKQSVYAEDITLTYDAAVFEFVRATGVSSNIQIMSEDTSQAGTVRLIAVNIGGVSAANSPILNLTFHVKQGVQNTSGTIATTKVNLGLAPEGTVLEAALSSKTIAVGSKEVMVDRTALTAAITNAQSLYDAAVVGTMPGQYPKAAKDAFGAAINAAKAVRDNSSATQSQIDSAQAVLTSAVEAFKVAVIKEVSADLNKDGSINIGDLAIVAYYYGKDSTDKDWATIKVADMNNDNKIDIMDLAYVASLILI